MFEFANSIMYGRAGVALQRRRVLARPDLAA